MNNYYIQIRFHRIGFVALQNFANTYLGRTPIYNGEFDQNQIFSGIRF